MAVFWNGSRAVTVMLKATLAVAVAGFIAAAILHSGQPLPSAAAEGTLTSTKALSMMLFRDFVYPFELTSFLILIAILGAIVLAQRER